MLGTSSKISIIFCVLFLVLIFKYLMFYFAVYMFTCEYVYMFINKNVFIFLYKEINRLN
jgi:hypothetical protein